LQHARPDALQPGFQGAVNAQVMLVVCKPQREGARGTESLKPLLQLLGRKVELGVARIAQTKHGEAKAGERICRQVAAKEEPPEATHIVRFDPGARGGGHEQGEGLSIAAAAAAA